MKLERKLAVVFAAAFVLATLTVLVAWLNFRQKNTTRAMVTRTMTVQSQVQVVLRDLIELETGQRGYVLTGDESYLTHYHYARTNLPAALDSLRAPLAAYPEQQRRLAELERTTRDLLAFRSGVVQVRKDKGEEDAERLVVAGRGKAMTDAARRIITEMQREEERRLSLAQTAARAGDQNMLFTMIALSVLIGLVLVGGWLTARHHLRQRVLAEGERDRFFEQSLDLLCIAGADGYFKRVNPAFTATLGWSADELQTKPFLEFVHPDDRESTVRQYEAQAAGKAAIQFGNRYRCKDGSYRFLSWQATAMVGGLVYAAARDETELRRIQEELRQSEEFLRVTLRSIGDAVMATDLDGRVTLLNPVAEKLTGWTEIEARGQPVANVFCIINEETRQPAVIPVEEVLAKGVVVGLANHTALIARNGTERPIADSAAPIRDRAGRVLGVVLVFRDVTEEKHAENALKKSAAEIADLYHNAPCGYHSIDATGTIVAINDTELRWLGYAREEVVGCKKIADLFTETSRRRLDQNFPRFKERGYLNDLEFEMVRKDGSTFVVMLSATAIKDAEGRFIASRSTMVDISERKAAEQTLKSLLRNARAIVMHATVTAPDGWEQHPPEWSAPHYKWVGWFEDEESAQAVLPLELQPGEHYTHGWARAKLREDWEPMNLVAARAFVSGATHWRQEFRAVDRHGAVHWFMQTAILQPTGSGSWRVTTINTDITSRKQAEEALRQSEERLAITLDSIGDGVLATDAQGRITRLNPVAEKLTGWTEAEAQGRPVEEVFSIINELTRQPAAIPVKQVLDTGLVVGLANHTVLIARGGTECPIADSAAPIRTGTGEVVGVVLVFRDVTEERKVQVAVEQAREYAQNIVQTVREPLVVLNAELQVSSANRAFYEKFGLNPEETTGRSLAELGRGEWDIPELRAQLERVIPEEHVIQDFEVQRSFPALGQRTLLLNACKIYRPGNNTKLILLSIEDVSARKQAELSLREINEALEQRVRERTTELEGANRRLRLADFSVSHASVGIAWADPDGRFLRANQSICDMLGYSEPELLCLGISDVNVHATPNTWPEHYAQLRARKHMTVTCQLRRKNGTYFPAEITRSLLTFDGQEYIVSYVRDVTERQQVEERLQAARAFSDDLINSIPGVFFCFTAEGCMLRWNHMIQAALEYQPEEITGMKPADFVVPEERMRVAEKIRETFERGHSEAEFTLLSRTGRRIPVHLSSRVVMVEGQPALLGTGVDLTERKNAERQMMRAQRMESIGALASGIAHDLNNALAPVLMGLSLLRQWTKPELIPTLDTMEASVSRGADMVRQLLTFGKGVEGRRLLLHPRHLVREMEKIIRGTFPKNILLQLNVPRDVAAVSGDPTQLHQVLLNLCVNARDAMPDGGTLTLEAANQEVDDAYAATIEGAKPGKYVVCRVVDTGTGIPPEVLERMFEPFFTTKSPDKGTGLGLSTVVGIVRSHGGFIQVQSKVGQGSTFAVYLPAENAVGDTERIERPKIQFRGHGELILVVEDEVSVRQVTCALLEKLNFKVISATDGTEALVRAAEHRDTLRIVITDEHMPHMDGLTFARALKRMVPEVALIVMSGRLDEHQEQEFRQLGMLALLAKPFTHEKLVEALQKAAPPE